MTTNQMATLQMTWKRRVDQAPCEHSNLELEWNERGHSTGHYACSLCGESMAVRPRVVRISTSPSAINGAFPSTRLFTGT
jgi:hypothetical protein